MTETIITFHNGSTVVTTDEVDFDMLKNLMDNQTKLFFNLSSDGGITAQTGIFYITGIEQNFNV